MDNDLSHAAIERFEAIEARLDALEGNTTEEPTEEEEEETDVAVEEGSTY